VVAVGKDLILLRQVGAATVHQINAGEVVFLGNLLGAQVFFHRHREIGAALHGGIVADHHDLLTVDTPDACDHACRRSCAIIHAMGRRRADLKKR